LLLLKPNRRWSAWSVLIPVAVISLFFILLGQWLTLFPMIFVTIFTSLVLGIAAVWLLSFTFENRRGGVTFLLAAAIMAGAGMIVYLSESGFDTSKETVIYSTLFGIFSIAVMAGMGIARYTCRRNPTPMRFRAWLPLWIIVMSALGGMLFAVTMSIITSERIPVIHMVLSAPAVSGVIGAILYLFLLPFLILASRNSVYRDRFVTVLRLEGTESNTTSL